MRKVAVISWLLVLSVIIAALFWHNEWVYSLPTPIPQQYRAIATGTPTDVYTRLPVKTTLPVFLHFYNPDCPCSRFNISHFRSLVTKYSKEVQFVIVPVTDKKITANSILNKFKVNVPVVFDSSLARTCGVYSTPQAVLIDTNSRLYYRGNYNRSRYCTDTKTEYARMAIDHLIHNNAAIVFDAFALKAYGCQLPKCTR